MTTTRARANWRTPDAVKVDVDEHVDRMAWLLERRDGIGGTDAATILGVHVTSTMSSVPTRTIADVYADKVAEGEPVEEDKPIFALGHAAEPLLIAEVERRKGVRTRRAGFYRHKDNRWAYASPDALSSDNGIIECKTAGRRGKTAAAWLNGEVSPHAFAQAQHYLYVTGRARIYFAVGIRDDRQDWESVPRDEWDDDFLRRVIMDVVVIGPVERDDEFIADMVAREREVWEAIVAREPRPEWDGPIDYSKVTPRAGAEVEAVIPEMVLDDIARLDVIKAQQAELNAERKHIEASLKGAIRDAEFLAADGRRVAQWGGYEKQIFDERAFRRDHPDLAAEYTTTTTYRRLKILKEDA